MAASHVGVEITEESVRAVEVTVGRGAKVIAYGEVALPPDAAKDSEVLDGGAVAVAIRQLWDIARIRARHATLGIASRRVLVREYSTNAMAPDLLRKALPFQVQDLLPVPVSQAVLDYYPTSQTGDKVNGLLVAAVAETVEQMIAVFNRSKVRVTGVDLTAFGLARAVRPVASGTTAVVHVGDHTTQVVIVNDGVPDFVRILPADLETTAVRRRAQLESGAPPDDLTADPRGAAGVVPRGALRADFGNKPVADLIGRLSSTLSFYLNRPSAAPISQILLTGAGASVGGVIQGLSTNSEIPVRLLSLGDVIGVRDTPPEGELALNLVGTAGLALGKDL